MAADEFKYDVFLSHSPEDKGIVRAMAERLRSDGLRVWFDEWEIRPGDITLAKTEDGLENSRVLVFCMSANAFGSDWTQLESYTYRFRDPLNKERRFIPLRLDNVPIKGFLALFRYIDWLSDNREQEYAKLLEACQPPSQASEPLSVSARESARSNSLKLGRYLAVALLNGNAVSILRSQDLALVSTIETNFRPAQLTPYFGRLFIFPAFDQDEGVDFDEVVDFDLSKGQVHGRVRMRTPFQGQLNETATKLYVTNLNGGNTVIVDPGSDNVARGLTSAPRPDHMALDASNHELFVADNSHGLLTVYNTTTDQLVRQFRAFAIQKMAVAAGKVYWATGSTALLVNNAFDFSSRSFIETHKFVWRIRVSTDQMHLWVLSHHPVTQSNLFHIIDLEKDSIIASYPFNADAWDFVIDEQNQTVYFALLADNAVGVLNLANGAFSAAPVGKSPIAISLVDVP